MASLFAALRENHPPSTVHLSGRSSRPRAPCRALRTPAGSPRASARRQRGARRHGARGTGGRVTRARVCYTCAAAGHFRAADEENLVVARSTNLEVYAMRFPGGSSDDAPAAAGARADAAGDAHPAPGGKPAQKAVLQCVGRYDLSGHVEAMALMKPPGKDRDCLLLVFRDAKMSVVEYSPATDEITTVALFMFEESELKRGRVSWHMPPGEHANTHARAHARTHTHALASLRRGRTRVWFENLVSGGVEWS